VYGRDLKEWAKTIAPTERPAFLFDEIERKTHFSINADSFRALQADRDALSTELDKTKDKLQKVRQEKNDLASENQSLRGMVDTSNSKSGNCFYWLKQLVRFLLRFVINC